MTHEVTTKDEPHGGPEHDHDLPDAGDVPEYDDVEESLAPPMHSTWAGVERNEP